MSMRSVPKAMTIAGSDSGGGAGIQADLKTFAALGVYGTSVITAITAQNTLKVTDILEVPPSLVAKQIDAVLTDIGTDAVKTGMLANAGIIEIVACKIKEYGLANLVVDPVMIAKGGDRLLHEEAFYALRPLLLPPAMVVSPNIPEAEALTGMSIKDLQAARDAARKLVAMGAKAAVVKGGHLDGDPSDILVDADGVVSTFTSTRINTMNTHGTGCTFASAITAGLAKGQSVKESVDTAKKYVTGAIRNSYKIGKGHGPLNHFFETWCSPDATR